MVSHKRTDPFLGAKAVTISDEELEHIVAAGLPDHAIRTMLYMHDIEFHTACYMRDLLVTKAHNDPETSAFMMRWGFEETHHGYVIAAILDAFGELSGTERIAQTRRGLRLKARLRPLTYMALDAVIPFPALHMVEGAVNEWTAQAAYRLLADSADNPVFSQVLGRIIRQEGAHAAFYRGQAKELLSESRVARRLARLLFRKGWQPVGAGVVDASEIEFVARNLFATPQGAHEIAKVDLKLQQLPGMSGLAPLRNAMDRTVGPFQLA